VLAEANRNINNGRYDGADFETQCDSTVYTSYTSLDWKGEGYYRFQEPAGTMLPETFPGYGHCATGRTGWLNGIHPEDIGVEYIMTACFGENHNNCLNTESITVTRCPDGGYVYKLPQTGCVRRYCGFTP